MNTKLIGTRQIPTDHAKAVCCLGVLFLAGCGLDGPAPSTKPDATPAASQAVEQKPAETEKAKTEPKSDPTPEPKPEVIREKAAIGMGEKGRGYGGGIVTEPVHVMFTAQEHIVLIQIENAMKMYKADHDDHPPKTQEEFMQKIVKENSIKLPVLPQGSTYFYDPKTGELMTQRPNNQ